MASKVNLTRKVLSLFLSFILFFTQTGFAQVAAELNLSSHFASLGPNITQNKLRLPHLRYLSYDNTSNNIQLLLDKGDLKDLKDLKLEESGKELLKYFLIGVTLPDDSFWVNLRPDSADNIIQDELAKTDIGKVFLEADVQLKKDTASLTTPDSPLGKLYWDKLYERANQIYGTQNVNIPTLTRPWIVPGEIIIREAEGNSAYIYKATLKVLLEQDHLKESANYNFEDNRAKELNEYSSQLIREFILPELVKKVNNDKNYAALRQVYYSLILARWFKSRFYGKGGLYASYINKSNLQGLTSKETWSKNTYFEQYQTSFKNGEYNLKTNINALSGPSIRSYFSGGLEFSANMNITSQNKGSSPIIAGFTGSSSNPVFMAAATKNGLVPFFGTATINNPISLSQGISSSPMISQSLGMFTSRNHSNNSLTISPIPAEMAKGKARIAVYQYFSDSDKRWLLFEAKTKNEVLGQNISLWLSGENIYPTNSNEWEYKRKGFHANIKITHNTNNNTLSLTAVANGEVSKELGQSTEDDFQIFLEPSSSSPISIQPVTSLRVYADINQRIWLDGLTFEMLLSGEFENLVRTHGINGVTTNPSLIKAYFSDQRVIDKAKELAAQGLDKKTIYYQLVSELAKTALEIFEKAGIKDAKFSVELNPAVNNADVAEALKEALLWTDINPTHMMIKVALSSDADGIDNHIGYKIIEEVISRGRNVNVTLIFTPEHYQKVVDAYIRGLQRGLINVKEGRLSKDEFNRVYSVASFFISRWDVYFEENNLTPENAHGQVANAIAIKAYNEIFKNSFSDKNPTWNKLKTDANAIGLEVNPQEFLLASTGSKGADMLKKGVITEKIAAAYPAGIYVHPLQGTLIVNTLPYTPTIKYLIENGIAKNDDGSIAKTIESGYDSSLEIMDLISKGNANITRIGAILLKNATTAFSNDYISVQNTLDNIVSGNTSSSPVNPPMRYQDATIAFEGFEETDPEVFNSLPVKLAANYELTGEIKQYPEPTGQLNSRFGYKDPNGALRMDNRKPITEWVSQVKNNGAKVMLHIGIGGQGKSNSVQAEYWGEDKEAKIIVLDRIGVSIKQLFQNLLNSGYNIYEIVLHASSKSGSTDEPLTIYQESLNEFLRLMGIAEGMTPKDAQALSVRFSAFLKDFNNGKSKSALFKGIPVDDFNQQFNEKERLAIGKVLERIVFTTSLNPDASRLYAFALGMKELKIANISVFDFSEYTGGRFTENCESGSVTQAFQGLNITQITEGLQKQASNYWGTDGNNPEKNSALRAAILTRKLNPPVMLVSVRSSNATSEALQKEQLFPESNGKDGQGIWVVVSAGQEEMNRKIGQIKQQTGKAPLVIVVEQKGFAPMAVPQDVPVIRYFKEEISPLANAKFALWFQEFTVRYSLLSLADLAAENNITLNIPVVGAALMNKSVLENKPNFWWLRDPQNQPMVELAKGVLVSVLSTLDKSDEATRARYMDVEKRIKNGEYILDEEINLTDQERETNLSAEEKNKLLQETAINLVQADENISVSAEDSISFAKLVSTINEINNLKHKNEELAAKMKLAIEENNDKRIQIQLLIEKNDEQIYELYKSIRGYGKGKLSDNQMEEAARKLATLMLIARGKKKVVSPVFYTAYPNADILGEMLQSIDYGIGTRDQHANFQGRLDGNDAVFTLLVDFVKSYEAVVQSESKISTYGLANDYLDGAYPDEERRQFLKAEFRSLSGDVTTDAINYQGETYKKRFFRDVAIVTLPDISTFDGLITAFGIFNRAQQLFESTSSSPINTEKSKRGGIDFRILPMNIQAVGSFEGLTFSLPPAATLTQININKELIEISQMVDNGIAPSSERIKELIGACYHKQELANHQEELVSCLMRICKLEEDMAIPTDANIKEAIVIADSVR